MAPTTKNPGTVLGIVSIVLAFTGISIVGIACGWLSYQQSKKVRADTSIGKIGLILSSVMTVIGFGVFIALSLQWS